MRHCIVTTECSCMYQEHLKCSNLACFLPRWWRKYLWVLIRWSRPAAYRRNSLCPDGGPRDKHVSMSSSLAYSIQNPFRLLHNHHVSTSCCCRRRRLFHPFQNAGWENRESRTATTPTIPPTPPTQTQLGVRLSGCSDRRVGVVSLCRGQSLCQA
jgi:hypothetical protein